MNYYIVRYRLNIDHARKSFVSFICVIYFNVSLSISPPGMPSFIKTPEDQTGISGGVASFVCQAVGEPKPRITWMKKGKKVSSQRFEVRVHAGWRDALSLCTRALIRCDTEHHVGDLPASCQLFFNQNMKSNPVWKTKCLPLFSPLTELSCSQAWHNNSAALFD